MTHFPAWSYTGGQTDNSKMMYKESRNVESSITQKYNPTQTLTHDQLYDLE